MWAFKGSYEMTNVNTFFFFHVSCVMLWESDDDYVSLYFYIHIKFPFPPFLSSTAFKEHHFFIQSQ